MRQPAEVDHVIAAILTEPMTPALKRRIVRLLGKQANALDRLEEAARYAVEVMRDEIHMRMYKNEPQQLVGMQKLAAALGWPDVHPPDGVYIPIPRA
jgi:hypothetical protein